ncbi:MAG: hypothetical protein J0L82_10150 [Deltaproteobacteria bacterium]|jgi:hypothetical protein|nr:hypothetical protein [Deltaproteobacteria bacterium]
MKHSETPTDPNLIKTANTKDRRSLFLTAFAVSLMSIGCGCTKDASPTDIELIGEASVFSEIPDHAFKNRSVVETSLVNVDGSLLAFYDHEWTGKMFRVPLQTTLLETVSPHLVIESARFPYTISQGETLFNFATVDGNVYLWKSLDLGLTWMKINGGRPVLRRSEDRSSIYHQLWNVAVDIADDGTWHLLVESSDSTPDQREVGLAYSHARLVDDEISFDENRSEIHVVKGGGNPWIKHIPGKGIFAIHGQAYTPNKGFGTEWYITASTISAGLNPGGTTWTTHTDKFIVGTKGVHVCDPHIVEIDGNLILSLSFGQGSTRLLSAPKTSQDLFESLK